MTDQEKVSDQCRAVAHMAAAIANVYTDLATIHANGGATSLVEMHGKRTTELMETLGDILNGMDAVTSDDDWVGPVMVAARKRWPLKTAI